MLQSTPDDAYDDLVGRLGRPEARRVIEAVYAVERRALVGAIGFADLVAEVLDPMGHGALVDDVVDLWCRLDVSEASMAVVADLRDAGVGTRLATNQHDVRTAYMRRTLDFDRLVGDGFYSCELGVAKPDPAYFTAIVDALGAHPGEVLFVDDRHDNVAAARTVGLQAEQWHLDDGHVRLREVVRRHLPTLP